MPQLPFSERPWMLVSDLDGTLLGDQQATMRFQRWWRQSAGDCVLVYATGRSFDSAQAVIRESGLPEPAAIIADVGTDIRDLAAGTSMIEWTCQWELHWEEDRVRQVLNEQPELEPQPLDCQTPFKCSYFVRKPTPGWLNRIRCQLQEQRIRAELVFSSNRDLDALPVGVNKGTAADFLAQTWQFSKSRVAVAGDTGNDLSMFIRGFRGILVANAHIEMNELADGDLYRSPHSFADGVIDGLEYWFQRQSHSVPSIPR